MKLGGLHRFLLRSTALPVLLFPAAVSAQDSDGASKGSIDDGDAAIVVTALKRSDTTLVETGASIAVIDGSFFDQQSPNSLVEVLQRVPGVSINTAFGAGTTNIQIRGVTGSFGAATVGYYLDDIPVSLVNFATLPDPAPFDLESVEVLRGPQGTLYGGGATGGVVLVKTAKPNLARIEAKGEAAYTTTKGGDDGFNLSGTFNLPLITDRLAVRASVSYRDLGGWTDRVAPLGDNYNDAVLESYRARLRAVPIDDLTIDLFANLSRVDQNGTVVAFEDQSLPGPFREDSTTKYDVYGATLNWDLPGVTVRNSTGYVEFSRNLPFALNSLLEIPTLTEVENFVNELRLNSNGDGPLSWVAGFFYRKADQIQDQDASKLGLPAVVRDETSAEQFSVFAETTVRLFDDNLDLTAGVGYFDDSTVQDSVFGALPVGYRTKTEAWSPKIAVAVHPSSSSTIFGSYSQGFRPANVDFGVSTLFARSQFPSYSGLVGTETTDAFELGAKGSFLGDALFVEAVLFYNEISNIQQQAAVQVTPTVVANTILNAGDATTKGFEWTVDARPVKGFSFLFSGAYIDATIDEDFFAPGANPSTATPLFRGGSQLNLIPEWLVSASVNYTAQLASGYRLTASGGVQHSSQRELTQLSLPPLAGDELTELRARLEFGRDSFTVFAFGENLANETGAVVPTQQFQGNLLATRLRPRTFGVGLRFNY